MAHAKGARFSKSSTYYEHLVNIDVDMATRRAAIAKRSLESYYSTGKVRRSGHVDRIDVAEQFLISRSDRDEALLRPDPRYRGLVVRSQAYTFTEYAKGSVDDWFEADENYSMIYAGDSLEKKNDTLLVLLRKV